MLRTTLKSFLFVLFFLPLLAHADAAQKLFNHLQPLASLSAHFQQTTFSQQGKPIQQSSGDMSVARGNRFRWHTVKPFEQLVVADGETVWSYDPGLLQVVIKPLATNLTATPALLFGGSLDQVRAAFAVEVTEQQAGEMSFRLTPKDKQAMFTRLVVRFDGDAPVAMSLVDALGQKTLIDFSQVKVNPELPVSSFRFTPPAGVDVIRQQP